MSSGELHSLLLIFTIAAVTPFLSEWMPRIRLPLVVLEIGLGILIGPQALGWAAVGPTIHVLSNFGLAFLFLLAGLEIDFPAIRGRPIVWTSVGWMVSFGLCLLVGLSLQAMGMAKSALIIGAALTTTALGTILPILRDAKELHTRFGAYAVAAGALGEFGPIILIALALSTGEGEHGGSPWLLGAFALITLVGVVCAMWFRPPRTIAVIQAKMHTSAQLPVRISILLLAGLVCLARDIGVDAILGALAAGVLISLASPGEHGQELRHKLEGIGFGVFVPIFFITTGLRYDLVALCSSGEALLQVPMFLILFLVVRGLPALLIRRDLDWRSRAALGLFSATQLPLVVAIAEIGVRAGEMSSATAAALVGAGMLSVLIFPLSALALRKSAAKDHEVAEVTKRDPGN